LPPETANTRSELISERLAKLARNDTFEIRNTVLNDNMPSGTLAMLVSVLSAAAGRPADLSVEPRSVNGNIAIHPTDRRAPRLVIIRLYWRTEVPNASPDEQKWHERASVEVWPSSHGGLIFIERRSGLTFVRRLPARTD
jgi:hypothetical protein